MNEWMNTACRGERGPFHLPAFAMVRGRTFSNINLRWGLAYHCGNSEVEQGQGKKQQTSNLLASSWGFPSSHRGWNSSFFLSLPSLTPSAFGLGFPFLFYLTQESIFFSLKLILGGKQKAVLDMDRPVPWPPGIQGHWGGCLLDPPAAQPRVWPQTTVLLGFCTNMVPLTKRNLKWPHFVFLRLAKPFTGVNWEPINSFRMYRWRKESDTVSVGQGVQQERS